MYLIIIILIFLIIANLLTKKSKPAFIITLAFMWLLMTFTTGNADHLVYESRFENPSIWKNSSEILFELLINFCRIAGMSYIQYKALLCFIILALIGSTIWKLSSYPNIVLILYFICPFALNSAQLRWAAASGILIFGYRYLVNDQSERVGSKKRNITANDIRYIVCVILATLTHTAAFFGLLLLLAKKISLKSSIIWAFVLNIFFLFIFTPTNIQGIMNRIGAGARMGAYFSSEYQQSEYRHIGWALLLVLITAAVVVIGCLLIQRWNKKSGHKDANIEYLLKSNILMLSIVAFIIRYTGEMYRPQEAMLILDYILLMNSVTKKSQVLSSKISYRNFFVQLDVFALAIGSCYAKSILSVFDTIWVPIFTQNILFK